MKKSTIYIFLLILPWSAYPNGVDPVVEFIETTNKELTDLYQDYLDKKINFEADLYLLNRKAYNSNDQEEILQYLVEKSKVEANLKLLGNEFRIKLAERRYRKGIELIRLLYEKILDLDYHFSAIQTNHHLLELANPHSYPDFKKMSAVIEKRMKKRSGFEMPALLQQNPYIASSFSVLSTFFGDGSKKEKESRLEEIACILDFTVQMNTDLKIIYYETEYLKASNTTLKDNCMDLFDEYTKVIGYEVPLDKCRDEDDWDNVFLKLEEYIENMKTLYEGTPEEVRLAYKKNSSIEFPLNLMTAFIHKYNNFIGQGKNYYSKFGVMLESYQNKATCDAIIPEKFKTLAIEINESVQKFDEAYNIAELKGSKLKDLLYGYDD